MNSLNVLVVSSIGEECLRRIAAVSPEIKVQDSSDIWNAQPRADVGQQGDISDERLDALLAQADVIFGYRPPKSIISRAPRLKWVQIMLAGVDYILNDDIVQSPVIVTTVSGVHATPISELVFEMMLMFSKRALHSLQLKQGKEWKPFVPLLLRSKTVGIVGLGNVGKEVARLAKAFGMRVLATRRSAKKIAHARNVDILFPREQLTEMLSESDFVVLILPLTPETDNMIGERELRSMKPTAYLINVGRGRTVDEEALTRALEENWFAGAGLDAFDIEPLPKESRLWELPNVILTCHIAGRQDNYNVITTELFCENLRRYLSGKKLINLVDKKRGY